MISKRTFVLIPMLVVLSLAACKQEKAAPTGGPAPVPVSLAKADLTSVPFELQAVGTVEAFATVQVKSQVSGQMLRAAFQEGQSVNAGDLLFEIDSRPYRETLRQAEAAVTRDRAQLRQAEAALARDNAQSKNADVEAARYDELSKAGVISKAQHEQVRTSADVHRESVRAARAAIESARAALEADLAAVERAKLDISYCEIRSPMAGRTGPLLLHPGNLVRANGDAALVVIHKTAPVYVAFSVPEQHLAEIRIRGARTKLPVRVAAQDNPERTATGHLASIDNAVDPGTGTIRLKAVFDNRDGQLWPGQFVTVALTLDTVQNATVVPSEAVQSGLQGQFIYVVKKDNSVELRPVTPGRSWERQTIIQTGIEAGETVVTDGQLRLFPGAKVRPVDAAKLDAAGKP